MCKIQVTKWRIIYIYIYSSNIINYWAPTNTKKNGVRSIYLTWLVKELVKSYPN